MSSGPGLRWLAADGLGGELRLGHGHAREPGQPQGREAIPVGADPAAVAVTPDGRTVYVASEGSGTLTPIDTATRRPVRAIKVGAAPVAQTITPNGRTIYVVSEGSSTVTPIAIATSRPGSPLRRTPRAPPSRPGTFRTRSP